MNKLDKLFRRIKIPHDWFHGVVDQVISPPFNIIIFARTGQIPSEHIDFHHRTVLIIGMNGTGTMEVDSRRVIVKKDEAFLIFPFQYHRCIQYTENIKWLYITFDSRILNRYEILRFTPVKLPLYFRKHILPEMVKSYLRTLQEKDNLILAFLLGSCLEIMKSASVIIRKKNLPYEGGESTDETIQKTCLYVYKNIGRHLTLRELADNVGVSVSTLRVLFKKRCKINLGIYVLRVKLTHAAILLHSTDKEIKTIAYECGFSSSSSLIRSFRKATGMTPYEYRLKARKNLDEVKNLVPVPLG